MRIEDLLFVVEKEHFQGMINKFARSGLFQTLQSVLGRFI